MKQTKLDWFKLSPTFVREMCCDLDAPAIAAVMMFMAHQAENPLTDYNPRSISFACGVHWPRETRDQDQVLQYLPRIGEFSCGFDFIELCKVALERNKNEGAIGGRKSAQLRAERRAAKLQTFSAHKDEISPLPAFAGVQRPLEPPLGGGLATSSINGGGVATPLEGPLEQREREKQMRAPGPPPSSGLTPVVGGPDPLVASSEGSSTGGPPSSATGFAEGEKWTGKWVCVGCGEWVALASQVGHKNAPLCNVCDLARVPEPLAATWGRAEKDAWIAEDKAFAAKHQSKPLPVGLLVPAAAADPKKLSVDPATFGDGRREGGSNVDALPDPREVRLSGLSRPERDSPAQRQVEGAQVREMPTRTDQLEGARNAQPSKGKGATQTASTRAKASTAANVKAKPKRGRPPGSKNRR